jgi:hypothetical protein
MRRVTVLLGVLACLASARPASSRPPRRALELSAQAGYGHVLGKDYDRTHELDSTRGGPSLALGLSYRSPYLFVPWLELGWAALQSSREAPKAREFMSEAPSESRLTTSYVLAGPGVEGGRIRFRAGIGLYRQQVTSSFAGHTITPSSWDMGYFLAYGVRVYDGPRFGCGLESAGLLMSESQLAYIGMAWRVWFNPWADLLGHPPGRYPSRR